jgi:hypothetical protein
MGWFGHPQTSHWATHFLKILKLFFFRKKVFIILIFFRSVDVDFRQFLNESTIFVFNDKPNIIYNMK